MKQLLQFLAMGEGMMQPAKYEEVDTNTAYVGYCSHGCSGTSDNKWLIKKIKTEQSEHNTPVQTISYANGSRLYNQKWDDRYSLTYRITESCMQYSVGVGGEIIATPPAEEPETSEEPNETE